MASPNKASVSSFASVAAAANALPTKVPAPKSSPELDAELDEFFAANPGRLFGAYVTYSSSLSNLQDNIIEGI